MTLFTIIALLSLIVLSSSGLTGLYGPGGAKIINGDIVVKTTAFKVLLVDNTYAFDPDHAFVSTIIAGAVEISATNYVRKAMAAGATGLKVTYDATANKIQFIMPDVTWVGLGGATNDNIGGAVVFNDTGNDATADAIIFLDPADLNTNGSDVLLDTDQANGNLQIQL